MSMNVIENVVAKKNTVVPYYYRRYPLELYKPGERTLKVNTKEEEEDALDNDYTENPPAVPESVAVAPMTTQPAIQAAYDALKKELDGRTAEFNLKYAQLQAKYDVVVRGHEALIAKHEALVNQVPEPTPDHPPTDEAVAEKLLEELTNPFAQMK